MSVVSASLYQRVLGDEFQRLPEVLRRFHGSPYGGSLEGRFRVERGAGRLRGMFAEFAELPPAGENVPLRVDVRVHGEEEHWTRSFGATRLETRQHAAGQRLVEVHPPWKLRIRLGATAAGMRLDHERCYWHSIPLPRAVSPRVETKVEAREQGWFVDVTVGLPVLGTICRYSGEVRPA